jgi:glutamate-ammonia-ligase adenylyltransferase
VTAFFERIALRPMIYDEARGADVLGILARSLAGAEDLVPAAKLLSAAPKVRELLAASFSGAPYLAALAQRDPRALAECLLRDPDEHLEEARASLASTAGAVQTSQEALEALR